MDWGGTISLKAWIGAGPTVFEAGLSLFWIGQSHHGYALIGTGISVYVHSPELTQKFTLGSQNHETVKFALNSYKICTNLVQICPNFRCLVFSQHLKPFLAYSSDHVRADIVAARLGLFR